MRCCGTNDVASPVSACEPLWATSDKRREEMKRGGARPTLAPPLPHPKHFQ